MKRTSLRTPLLMRSSLVLLLAAFGWLSLTIETDARSRKRSGSGVRRSHSAKTKAASEKTDDAAALVNATPRLKLVDNTFIAVDDAWESAQGIWYRKNGVTYLVERAKVRTIERGRTETKEPKEEAVKTEDTVGAGTDSKNNPVWIYLVGGARVEADDVTESAAGAWLRRGNLSVFIDRVRIERIEREVIATAAEQKGYRGWNTGSATLNALIKQNGARYGVDPYLIFLVMEQESHFNPRVVSPKGARGLMQLMPGTAARFGVRNSFSPAENISGGVRYLKLLLQTFHGRVDLVLASYNAGEGAVAKFGHRVPPYRETRNYVKRIGDRYRRNEVAQTAQRTDRTTGKKME